MLYTLQNGVLDIIPDPEDGIKFKSTLLSMGSGTWEEGDKSGKYRASMVGENLVVVCYTTHVYEYGSAGGYSLRSEWIDSPGYDSRGTHSKEEEYRRFSIPLHEEDKAPDFSGTAVVAGYGYNGNAPVFILADPSTKEAVAVFVDGRGHWRHARKGLRLTDKWSGKPDPRIDQAAKQGFIIA